MGYTETLGKAAQFDAMNAERMKQLSSYANEYMQLRNNYEASRKQDELKGLAQAAFMGGVRSVASNGLAPWESIEYDQSEEGTGPYRRAAPVVVPDDNPNGLAPGEEVVPELERESAGLARQSIIG